MRKWRPPLASQPLMSAVAVPGSKSATARALVLSALAEEPSTIRGGLRARDTSLMIAALRALGASIDDNGSAWRIHPTTTAPVKAEIDCGLAGTVARFLPPVAAVLGINTWFRGDPQASARPMAPLLEALTHLGAQVSGTCLPFEISGMLTGCEVSLDASGSSQYISGLLIAAPRSPRGFEITHQGGPLPSLPHIEMTIAALRARGVQVDHAEDTWIVDACPILGVEEVIEPDLTTAAAFLAAPLIAGGSLTVRDWPTTTTQPGARIAQILEEMGAGLTWGTEHLTVHGTGELHGLDIDLRETSELTPVIAGLALFATTTTTIRGIGHIRGHETDRIAALCSEINALGGDCQGIDDGLVIRPRPLHSGVFHTWGDHRLAHTGALIGLRVASIELDDVDVTSKTMPKFPEVWESLVA